MNYGATGISDAYLISQTIPGTIFQLVGTGLLTCFIPIYFKVLHHQDNVVAYTNKILNLVFLFSSCVILVIWLDTPLVVKIFASGFTGETLYYGIWFTRIGVLSLYFSSMIYVFNSYLQANNIFTPTVFAAVPNSLFIMFAIVLGAKVNVWLLSVGSTLAVGVQLLVLLLAIRKTPYTFHFENPFKDSYVRQFFMLLLPVIFGVSLNEINTLVDRTLASQIAIGGISALTYANSLVHFIQGGLIQPVVTVFYPKITHAAQENILTAKKIVEYVLHLLMSLLLPISLLFAIFSQPITEVLFGRGVFDKNAVVMTSVAVRFYSLGLCFVGIRELLSRYFYANADTKTPMVNASIGVAMNVFLNIFLTRYLGIAGLAIATSVSALITTLLLLKDCGKKNIGGYIVFDFKNIFKIILATFALCLSSYLLFALLPFSKLLSILLAFIGGFIVYAIVGYLLRLEIISFAFAFLRNKIRDFYHH